MFTLPTIALLFVSLVCLLQWWSAERRAQSLRLALSHALARMARCGAAFVDVTRVARDERAADGPVDTDAIRRRVYLETLACAPMTGLGTPWTSLLDLQMQGLAAIVWTDQDGARAWACELTPQGRAVLAQVGA